MSRRVLASVVLCCLTAHTTPLLASTPSFLTGSVIGDGGRPIAGATVQVLRAGSARSCEGKTDEDGNFSFSCAATGSHVVRASFGNLRPWDIEGVELAPGYSIHLNFLLSAKTAADPGIDSSEETGFWSSRLPNPIVARWKGSPISLRMVAIAVAAISFVLGALTMVSLGRWFGVEKKQLSAGEVGDMVLNPHIPAAGERVTPVAVVGARGGSATVSYGAEEVAGALAARRYGMVFVSLVVAPALFALASAAFSVAVLIGQEMYLFYALLLVPAGFVLTPIVIGLQAIRRGRKIPPPL